MIHLLTYKMYILYTDKQGEVLYYTQDIVHRDEDGDYRVYGRDTDARYQGELLNLPSIEGAAVSQNQLILAFSY